MKTKILITGAAGFCGHHMVEHFLKNTDWDIYVLDKLTYASNGFDRLRDIEAFDDDRVKIFAYDFASPISDGIKQEIGNVDYIVNLASESHVDNSIDHPVEFIQNNVNLVIYLLEWVREMKGLKKYIQFSTDEVYGSAPDNKNYKEGDRHNPGNPYSASKSSQEAIVRAYANTYRLPIIITNTMNLYGERQHPEKYIPMCIRKILNGETITIHSNADKTKAGTRYYIHARNVASAIHFILEETYELTDKLDASKGLYNIVGEREVDNLEMAQFIAKVLGKELKYEMVDFHSSRPGHDLRYGLDGTKLSEAGWNIPKKFEESLKQTIEWFIRPENKRWLNL